MKIIAKAKPVKFHITSSGKDCFSLEELRYYFNLDDVKKLTFDNNKMNDWLRSLKTDEANRIADELDVWQKSLNEETTEESINIDLVQLFFPKEPGISNYDYLLRHQNTNLYDIIWHSLYKTDKQIAQYCLENHLAKLYFEISEDSDISSQKEVLLSKNDIASLYHIENISNKNDVEICQIIFPQEQHETRFQYLLRFENSYPAIFHLLFKQSYKYDPEIALYGLRHNLVILTNNENATPSPSNFYSLTQDEATFLVNSSQSEKIKEEISAALREVQSKIPKYSATDLHIIQKIKSKTNNLLNRLVLDVDDAQAIEKDLENWGNKQQFLKEDHDVNALFHFLDWALCVLIVYIDNPFKAKKCLIEDLEGVTVDYELCFGGIFLLFYDASGDKKAESYFRKSAHFPLSKYMLQQTLDSSISQLQFENLKLKYDDSPNGIKLFIKHYFNYVIEYIENNAQ